MKEVDGLTTTIRKTYNAGGTSIAVRTIVNGTQNTLNWLLSDHLGSASITTTADGTWFSELRYSAFGETRYSSGITGTDYRYTGQLQQADINLYYYNARFYDPALGRFVQSDTIIPGAGDSKSYDRYAYVNNNPILYTDPSGHCYTSSGAWIPGGGDAACSFRTSTPITVETSTNSNPMPTTLPSSLNNSHAANPNQRRNQSYTALPQQENKPSIQIFRLQNVQSNQPMYNMQYCTEQIPCLNAKGEHPAFWDTDPSHPDYTVLTVSGGPLFLPGFTFTLTQDRYQSFYVGIGANLGESFGGVSSSITNGYIGDPFDDKIPDAHIESFLTGFAINVSGGALGGGGATYSPHDQRAWLSRIGWEYGAFLPPSAGISIVYGMKIESPFRLVGEM